jgi:ubiquitin-conjugating enzyme E2 C
LNAHLTLKSASPLNGQAAELWDKDPAEYKRLVLARHRDLSDEELGDGA